MGRHIFQPINRGCRLPAGDELRLRHPCPRLGSPPWVGIGFVARLDDASEEVAIELRSKEKGQSSAPTDVTTGFIGEARPHPTPPTHFFPLCRSCCAPPSVWLLASAAEPTTMHVHQRLVRSSGPA